MTVATAAPTAASLSRMSKVNACFGSSNVMQGITTRTTPQGTLILEKLPVFRAGTFKDSRGDQMTWEPEHLMQMVFNFDLLRSRGILPNVPMREGHPSIFGGSGEVVGYHLALEFDQASGRLLADIELTEPAAIGKAQRGTYRARSAEIGMYETNDEALYWPVFMGCAFVDIPAVEGLYSKETQTDGAVVLVIEEDTVTPKTSTHSVAAPEAPATTEPPAAPAATTEPPAAPAATTEPPAAPAAPAATTEPPAAPAAPATHAAPAVGTQTFTVNGATTTDFGAVQAHIDNLETFQSETLEAGRKNFVAGLAKANKITQPQVEGLTAFALSLDAKQYDSFVASYEAAPSVPLLATHAGATNPGGDAPTDENAEEIGVLEERLKTHRAAGMSEEQIAQTPSAKRLVALQSAATKE